MTEVEQSAAEREAIAFTRSLFEHKPSNAFVQIWSKKTKSSFYETDVDAAARRAVRINSDAYLGVSLVGKDLGKKRRGKNTDAIGIPGFWADVDVNGGPENKKDAAPDFDAAFEVATCVLKPTVIVCSGYGLQAWYLFEEPWIFSAPAERERASQLAAGWIARLRTEAQGRGFTIDATQDLARLMRVPGTQNAKGGQRADVTGYEEAIFDQDGPRYTLEALAEHAVAVAPASIPGADVSVDVDQNAAPPFGKLEALRENNPRFEQTWKRERQDLGDKSPSGYCLSIASFCVHAGFSDQEIANTLIAYRSKHGDDDKYPDWYMRTIRKARSTVRTARREERREDAVEQLVEIGESDATNGAVDADRIVSLFSEMLGGGYSVKELVQSNTDPDSAIFRLILSNGDVVKVGQFANLYDPVRFAQAFAVVTGHVPAMPKRPEWIKALNGLMKVRVVRNAEVTTLRSQVLTAMRSYVEATLTPDHHEAAARRDPFEKNGFLWIAPKSFHDYMTRQLRKRISFGDLEEVLDTLGFEKRAKNFRDPETKSGQNTTRDYYRGSMTILDEAPASNEDDDEGDAHDLA